MNREPDSSGSSGKDCMTNTVCKLISWDDRLGFVFPGRNRRGMLRSCSISDMLVRHGTHDSRHAMRY